MAKLKECPKPPWRPPWPQGTKQPFTPKIAQRFFDLLSTSDSSLLELLRDNPELPPYRDLNSWRCNNKNGFGNLWRKAREAQAEFLIQKALDLQKSVTPQTAHVARVRFDILRYIASRFHPEVYGDKPQQQQQTTVNVGVSISPERLSDLRTKLDQTRLSLSSRSTTSNNGIK